MVDIGLYHAHAGIKFVLEMQEIEKERERKRALKKDSAYMSRRLTQLSRN